jgi:hypothetical protein
MKCKYCNSETTKKQTTKFWVYKCKNKNCKVTFNVLKEGVKK